MSKFVSEKQIIANRINAKKGGVKTPEGKEISKMNALSFGVYSPRLYNDAENKKYTLIRLELFEEYKPEGISEESFVNQIALCEIKLQRILLMEEYFNSIAEIQGGFLINDAFFKDKDELGTAIYDYMMMSTDVLKVRNLDQLEKIQKYRNMIENRKDKYLNELMKIKYFKKNCV